MDYPVFKRCGTYRDVRKGKKGGKEVEVTPYQLLTILHV